MKKRVVITGLGLVTPLGDDIKIFWESLIKGVCGIGRVTYFDVTDFPTKIASEVKNFDPSGFINPKKIKRMDRFSQYAVVAAKKALEDSGIDLSGQIPERMGVIVGSGIGGLNTIEEEHKSLLKSGVRRISPFFIPKLIINIAAAEIALQFGIRGPNYATSSACATGAHAIGDAMRIIQYGDADVIFAGGAEAAITPLGLAGFCAARALSVNNDDPEHASRPFDKNRDGFVMGEGSGILVLEEYEHAMKRNARIYAELSGYGATDDAYHITAPEPNAIAASKAIENALKDASVSPEKVSYINAHGTSTPLNDKVETLAIKKVFGDLAYKIPISSTKSMIGHLLGAAGAVEAITCLLSMRDGIIHPTINYKDPDPECDLDYVPNTSRECRVDIVISNSLGFGGHNCTLLFKKIS